MSEFEHDFENEESVSEIAAVATIEEIEAETAPVSQEATVLVEEDDETTDDDFFAEEEEEAIPEVDPATIITIRTSASSDKLVEAAAPMPLVDAITKSGLRFNGDYTCWLNGQEVGLGTMVSGGMTVTVVGSVKGGSL